MKQSNFIIELQYQYLNYITGIPVLYKILKKIHNTGKKNYTSDRQVQEIQRKFKQLWSIFYQYQQNELVLLWAQLIKIYLPLPTSVQPISITKTLLIALTKYERDPPLFTGKLLIKFQNILRNTTQVIIWHRVKIIFSVISSPITLEQQKWKSSKMKGVLLFSPVNSW
jgi:hypothetical protein